MASFDQRGQNVETQYNAEKIVIYQSPPPDQAGNGAEQDARPIDPIVEILSRLLDRTQSIDKIVCIEEKNRCAIIEASSADLPIFLTNKLMLKHQMELKGLSELNVENIQPIRITLGATGTKSFIELLRDRVRGELEQWLSDPMANRVIWVPTSYGDDVAKIAQKVTDGLSELEIEHSLGCTVIIGVILDRSATWWRKRCIKKAIAKLNSPYLGFVGPLEEIEYRHMAEFFGWLPGKAMDDLSKTMRLDNIEQQFYTCFPEGSDSKAQRYRELKPKFTSMLQTQIDQKK